MYSDILINKVINKTILNQIINEAVDAPSGENCQPWKFTISGEKLLTVYCIKSRDRSVFNSKNRTTLIACGALLQNIDIIAHHYGYIAKINIFPDSNDDTCIATITFTHEEASLPEKETLYRTLHQRKSTRGPFKKTDVAQFEKLIRRLSFEETTTLKVTTQEKHITTLAHALSVNDFLIIHNKHFHHFFFSHIIWNQKSKNIGFLIKTLGISPLKQFALYILRFWFFTNILNKCNFAEKIANDASEVTATASLIGCFCIKEDTPRVYIDLGKDLQKVWLFATSQHFSFQNFGAPLLRFTKEEYPHIFTEEEHIKIEDAILNIETIFKKGKGFPVLLFRVGEATRDVPKTKKMKPFITYR